MTPSEEKTTENPPYLQKNKNPHSSISKGVPEKSYKVNAS